jgi:hypothetical protein
LEKEMARAELEWRQPSRIFVLHCRQHGSNPHEREVAISLIERHWQHSGMRVSGQVPPTLHKAVPVGVRIVERPAGIRATLWRNQAAAKETSVKFYPNE